MPQIIHLHRSNAGLDQYLGANPRSRQPAEDRYHFARLVGASAAVDLNQPKLLSEKDGKDHRVEITNQQRIGSCTAWTDAEINYWLSSFDTGTGVMIHPGWVYEASRKQEQTWPADSGAYEADALDITMKGAPLLSAAPYVGDQPGYDYSTIDSQADPHNSAILRHMPFVPADGNVLENIWTSIDSGFPVAVAMAWLSPFFNPSGGKLPEGVNPADVAGGHEITCWGIVPGFVLCANHWTAGWAADAASFGFTMRPGDFAIPWSYFTMPNSIIWELRSVSPIAIAPQPQPDPKPNPQPTPTPSPADPFWNYWGPAGDVASAGRDVTKVAEQSGVLHDWLPYLQQNPGAQPGLAPPAFNAPPPSPAQSCTTPALKVSDTALAQLKHDRDSSPFSRPKHYRVEGAQQLRDAIANSGI